MLHLPTAIDTIAVTLTALDVHPAQDMQDDLADLMEESEEIQEMMGRSYG